MIDFIRVHYSDKEKLENFVTSKGNFNKVFTVFEYHSETIQYPYKANLQNMEIVINDKGAYVKNSIHKLNNLLISGEEHNYNDFSYSQLISVTDFLSDNVVGINDNKLTQLEFGFNLTVPKSAESIIKKNILMHNLKRHSAMRRFKGKGCLLEFEHSNYIIKIYDKAKQYKRSEHTLRFEIKFLSNKEFNPLGIYNIGDLTNKDNLKMLFEYLMKRFEELLIVDVIQENLQIPEKEIDSLNSFSSFSYWENLSEEDKRQKKMNDKRKYFKLLEKHDLLKTKKMLRNQLDKKFEKLINE
jgi:hypothetical protein